MMSCFIFLDIITIWTIFSSRKIYLFFQYFVNQEILITMLLSSISITNMSNWLCLKKQACNSTPYIPECSCLARSCARVMALHSCSSGEGMSPAGSLIRASTRRACHQFVSSLLITYKHNKDAILSHN